MSLPQTLTDEMRVSGATNVNAILAFLLLAITAIAPVPLGSNNAVAWTVSAAIIGMAAAAYGITLVLVKDNLRVSLIRIFPEAVLWGAMLTFAFFQLVPAFLWGGRPQLIDVEGNAYPLYQISAAPGMSVLSAINFAGYALFFFLSLQVTANRRRAQMLAECTFAVVVAHAVWGLLALTFWNDSLLLFDKWAYQGVATGTFVNRNSYATFLAVGFVLGTSLTLRTALRKRSERGQRLPRQDEAAVRVGLFVIGTILILATLLATQSRMGLIAGLFGTCLVFGVVMAKLWRGRMRGIAIFLIIVICAAMSPFATGTMERLGSSEVDGDIRLQLYAQVLDMISRNWLTGTGAGSFEVVYPLFHRWPVSPDLVWDKAHNTYLSLWADLGVIAGSVPVIVFALLAWRLVLLVINRTEDWWLPTIALSTISIVSIHSLVDFSMEIQGVTYLVLFVVALGVDVRRPDGKSRQVL